MASSIDDCEWTETRNVLQEFRSLLSCSFCAELATSPYKLGRCSHIFCDNCVEHLKGGKCPVSNCGVYAPAREIHKDQMLQDLTENVLGIEKLILEKPVKKKDTIKSTPNTDIGRKVPPASSHSSKSVKPVNNQKKIIPIKSEYTVLNKSNVHTSKSSASLGKEICSNNSITLVEGAVASDSDNFLKVTSPSKHTSDTNNNPSTSGNITNSNGNKRENSSSPIIESVCAHGNSEMFKDTGTSTATHDSSVMQEPSQTTRHVEVQLSEVDGKVKISMEMDANIFNEVGPSLFSTLYNSNLSVQMRY